MRLVEGIMNDWCGFALALKLKMLLFFQVDDEFLC